MRRGSEQGVRVAFAPSAWVAPHPKAEKRDISGGAFRAIRRQGTRQGTNYVYVFHTYSSHFGDVCRYIPREGASWELNRVNALHLALGYIPREGASWEFKHRHERIAQRRYIPREGASWENTWLQQQASAGTIHPARGCELGVDLVW